MISKRDIAKIAKHVLKRHRGVRDHQIIHPMREWTVGLFGGMILLILGATWSVLTYREVSNRGVENAGTVEVEQTIYRDDLVNAALEKLRERQADYQALLDNRDSYQPSTEEMEEEVELVDDEEGVEITEEELLEYMGGIGKWLEAVYKPNNVVKTFENLLNE